MRFEQISKLIKKGDLVGLRNIFDKGIDPNMKNKYEWTLLMIAALKGNSQITKLILSKGGDPNLSNKFGDTAISIAASKGQYKTLDVLLKNGGKIESFSGNILEHIKLCNNLSPEQEEKVFKILRGRKINGQTSASQ